MKITKLRANIFQVFEKIEKTGIPVDVERNGKKFRIISLTPADKFANARFLPDSIVGDPDALDRIDWSKGWAAQTLLSHHHEACGEPLWSGNLPEAFC